jgi:calcineurin-like phosphoesterase family protein
VAARNRRRTWYTSDLHLGHAGLIERGVRRFASVEAMDDALVAGWNAVVGPADTVWVLGDFTLLGAAAATAYLERLNGAEKHLVWGNHDRNSVRRLPAWASSRFGHEMRQDGRHLVLCHYAMRHWIDERRGSVMLHGHSHGTMPGIGNAVDVGVDCWDLAPVSLDRIVERAATQPRRHQDGIEAAFNA